jgi:hypothetical protein
MACRGIVIRVFIGPPHGTRAELLNVGDFFCFLATQKPYTSVPILSYGEEKL